MKCRIWVNKMQDYVRIVFIRKWWVLIIFLLFLGASTYYITATPPVYESRVLLMRETASERLPADIIGLPLAVETWDEGQELLLKSFSSLADIKERLLEKHGYEVAVEQLEEDISLSPYGESSTMLELKAKADTPQRARALASVAADTYIQRTTDMKRTELSQGLKFLKQQMEQFDGKTHEAERTLSNFREREGLILTTSERASNGLIEKLGNMQSELIQTQNDTDLAKSQLQSVQELISEKKKYAQSSSVAELSPQIDQIQERLIGLQLELSAKRETRTAKDPEVIAVQRKIDVAQKQLKTEFDKLLQTPSAISLDPVSELQSLMNQYVTLNVQLKGLERKAELIQGRIDDFRAEHPELISKQVELTRLERQARVYEQTYATLMTKYEDMRLLEQMKTSGLRVVDAASLPGSPISPKKVQAMAIGILLGLSLGIGGAFFLEYLDDSVKRKEDVERFLELPLLAAIPKAPAFDIPEGALSQRAPSLPAGDPEGDSLPEVGISESSSLVAERSEAGFRKRTKHQRGHRERLQRLLSHSLLYAPDGSVKSPLLESYRNLAANVRYADIDNPMRSVLVTSAAPGEGKTVTASNLAIVMAQSGVRTLLVDADLRRPRLHRIFQQDRAPGLSDLLTLDDGDGNMGSDPEFRDFARPTAVENLYLLPCGGHISNPGVLFPTERMRSLVKDLAQQYDLVIFDSPPLGSVADSVSLSTEVDGTLMVIWSGETKRKICLQAKENLDGVGADVIGVVLNGVDYTRQYGYYYYHYRYYYGRYRYYYTKDEADDGE